jgi:hypothetical protein
MAKEIKNIKEIPNIYSNRVDATASSTDICLTFSLTVPQSAKEGQKPTAEIIPQARVYLSREFFINVRDLLNRISKNIEDAEKQSKK